MEAPAFLNPSAVVLAKACSAPIAAVPSKLAAATMSMVWPRP